MDLALTMEVCVMQIDEKTIEPLFVSSLGGDEYFVESLPFITDKVSRCDIIRAARNDTETLYFSERLNASGHKTISIIVDDADFVKEISEAAERDGLLMEQNDNFSLVSIDIPIRYNPEPLLALLKDGKERGAVESYSIR